MASRKLLVSDVTYISDSQSESKRKSSPSANLIYSHKIHNISDPDGKIEAEINKLARRLSNLDPDKDAAQWINLRERLASKCLAFFYITGDNVSYRADFEEYSDSASQIDEIFIDAFLQVVDRYDSKAGLFTHMLRSKFAYKRTDAAYEAAKSDARYGGDSGIGPLSLQETVNRSDGDARTVEEELASSFVCEDKFSNWLEEPSSPESYDDSIDSAILLKTIAIIAAFLGKTGKAENETRKLYTKMFFSETLTRITKTRTIGELPPLIKQEKSLFAAVELPFQDYYTTSICRNIAQLWKVQLVEGIAEIGSGSDRGYAWSIPAIFYIHYLESIERSSSNALVSQQRKKYNELLAALIETE